MFSIPQILHLIYHMLRRFSIFSIYSFIFQIFVDYLNVRLFIYVFYFTTFGNKRDFYFIDKDFS